MHTKKIYNFFILVVFFTLAGCDDMSHPYNTGNMIAIEELQSKVGVWTQEDVNKNIGYPSFEDPTNPLKTYYVGEKGKVLLMEMKRPVKSQVILVEYSKDGKLKAVKILK